MSSKTSFEEALAAGVKDGKVPHAIVYATNRDGSFKYHHATGLKHYGVDNTPIKEDDMLMLASQTKLLTAIAIVKAREQGLVSLDDDVAPHLPELAALQILTGFDDDGKPILKDRTKPITLRHLVTHSSGISYHFAPPITKWQEFVGRACDKYNNAPTVVERHSTPLMFEPGEGWMYSPGPDWAGLLLERVTGISLEEYMQTNLWKPLGVDGITFWPYKDPKWKDRIPQLLSRTPEGTLAPYTQQHFNSLSTDCFGGGGIYATVPAFHAVLQDLLNPQTSKLLSPASIEELFRPQFTSPAIIEALTSCLSALAPLIVININPAIPVNHSLGGLIFLEDDTAEGRRKKGTTFWGGLTNTIWFVDREAGLALTFGTQVMPSGDSGCREIVGIVEKEVYKMAGVQF